MSEPYSAMLRLRMCRQDLARWLAAPVPTVSRWSDWRGIAGQWRMHNGGYLLLASVLMGVFVFSCTFLHVTTSRASAGCSARSTPLWGIPLTRHRIRAPHGAVPQTSPRRAVRLSGRLYLGINTLSTRRTFARGGVEDDRPVGSADDAGTPRTGFTDLYYPAGHSAPWVV